MLNIAWGDVVALCMLVAFALVIVDTIYQFVVATGSFRQRLWAAVRKSATIAWARFVVTIAATTDGLVWFVTDVLNSPGVAAAIQQYLDAKTVAFIMIAVALVSELARRRKGSGGPVAPAPSESK